MTQAYSNPERESDEHALPDIEVFELTAREAAELDDEAIDEFIMNNRPKFDLAGMNGKAREAMYNAFIEENGITGGWFYWFCFPGCLPDSEAVGPFKSYDEALADAQNSD